MKFGLLGAVLGASLLYLGGQRFSGSLAYTRVETESLDAFLAHPRPHGWVKLTDVHVSYPDTIYIENLSKREKERADNGDEHAGSVSQVFTPAITSASSANERAKVLIEQRDETLKALVEKAQKGNEQAVEELIARQDDTTHAYQGMLQPFSSLGVDGEKANVAPDAVILTEGEEPRPWPIGLIEMLGGLTIWGSIFYWMFIDRRLR